MNQSFRRVAVALSTCVLILCCAPGATAAPWDLPCDLGPMVTSPGTIGASPNGPGARSEQQQRLMQNWKGALETATGWSSSSPDFFALNPADGFAFNHRGFVGISFTWYEFDKLNGESIPEIRTDVAVLEGGVQFGKSQKRGTRVGVRVPYVDYYDADPMGGPYSESGLFDIELFADVGLSWDDDPNRSNQYLNGMVIETRLTLPTGDEEEALGREGATLGVRPRWFLRWTAVPQVNGAVVANAPRGDVQLTQVHVSAGLGYVWDFENSDLSFWSPVVGLLLGWNDRFFVEWELQGELHDDGPDQYDLTTDLKFRLLPETGDVQVFLSVGGVLALNDEGLRDRFAPAAGVTFGFGQSNR